MPPSQASSPRLVRFVQAASQVQNVGSWRDARGGANTLNSWNSDWVVFVAYADSPSAEAVASLLRAEDVPARVERGSPIPGLEQGARVMVPKELLHRANFVREQNRVTDAELDYLATHSLGEDQ